MNKSQTKTGVGWVIFPALVGVALLTSAYLVFWYAPAYFNPGTDQEMGFSGKIFYFHVGSAFSWYIGVIGCAAGSIGYLIMRRNKSLASQRMAQAGDRLARSSGEVAVVLGALILVTGPIWAKPNWGTYWTAEPRLMLALFLEFVLIGYVVLRKYAGRDEMGKRLGAGIAIIGVPAAYFIHMAVTFWEGGNHPSVIGKEGGGWEGASIWTTAGVTWSSMILLAILLIGMRYRHHRAEDDIESLFLEVTELEDMKG